MAEATEKTEQDPKPSKTPIKGKTVKVVTAKGDHLPAEVIAVREGNLADVKFTFNGQEMTITSAPFDATGTKADSWH